MGGANGELRLMYVLPHPDDETLGAGGALARYAAEGVGTYLVTATRGERGWWGPQAENPGLEAVGALREAELRCAAQALGLREVVFLDVVDGEVDQADPGPLIAAIAGHIGRVRPQVVVTFGPDGVYGHPDHIALSQLTTAAVVAAADAGFAAEGGGPPHCVDKLYYMVETAELMAAYEALVGEISMTVDGRTRRAVGWGEWMVTTRIDASEHIEAVWRAMACHRSQHAGMGGLLALPEAERRRLVAARTYYRAFSFVNGGRGVESDLFEGLR